MDQKQSFNLNADFLGDYTAVFMKLVLAIIAVYLLIMIVNFLRDKFIKKEVSDKKDTISDLLIILHKLFFLSGFGFIIANVFQFLLNQATNHQRMNFRGDWDDLTFGIIILFIGLGFKLGNEVLRKNQGE